MLPNLFSVHEEAVCLKRRLCKDRTRATSCPTPVWCTCWVSPESREKGSTFHKAPKDKEKRACWLKALRCKDRDPDPSLESNTVWSASISYIRGFYAYALKQLLLCKKYVSALLHSREDLCPDSSLILILELSWQWHHPGSIIPVQVGLCSPLSGRRPFSKMSCQQACERSRKMCDHAIDLRSPTFCEHAISDRHPFAIVRSHFFSHFLLT